MGTMGSDYHCSRVPDGGHVVMSWVNQVGWLGWRPIMQAPETQVKELGLDVTNRQRGVVVDF